LRYVDGNLALRHGLDALTLVKAVLVDKIAIEHAASMYGAKGRRQQRYWGWASGARSMPLPCCSVTPGALARHHPPRSTSGHWRRSAWR
jgi:hypothetical protein